MRNTSLRTASTDDLNTGTNNFNISIQYNDTIEASYIKNAYESEYLEEGQSYVNGIYSLTQSDTRYYDNWNSLDSNVKTSNDIYTYSNTTRKYFEYVPGTPSNSVPTFDMSEIFVRDFNTINRANILSFGSDASAYYSYIGSDYTLEDKSILKIGTSTTNINIGDQTLVANKSEELFNKQRQLNVEFDNTRISSYAYIGNDLITEHDTITYGTTWRRYDIYKTTYWTTTFRQTGRYFMNELKAFKYSDTSYENNNVNDFSTFSKTITDNLSYNLYAYSYSFIAMTVPEQMHQNQAPFNMYFLIYFIFFFFFF